MIWPDGAIINQWIEVMVLATANTGLAADDVFYLGSAVGNCDGDGEVGSSDYGTFAGQFGLSGGIGTLAAGSHFWRSRGARVLWVMLDRRRPAYCKC